MTITIRMDSKYTLEGDKNESIDIEFWNWKANGKIHRVNSEMYGCS